MLKEVAFLFLKLGLIAFGGPAAHIAMMEREVFAKRKWMSEQHFLDLVGATNIIPGPNSTEMAIHCGYHRAGIRGLILAGFCFIFPAVTLTGFLAFLYVRYGTIPQIEPFFVGIKPAVIVIILSAVYKLARKAVKGTALALVGVGVLVLYLFGVNAVVAILAGGLVGMALIYSRNKIAGNSLLILLPWPSTPLMSLISLSPIVSASASLSKLFLIFLKIGAVLFGSGYVLVAYLDSELVKGLGWLTSEELLDAIAIGQFTPGPVLSTATFIGYQIKGVWGAIAATAGIFLPSFFFVAILNPLIPKLRKSQLASAFLDAVNVSAVGIMLGAAIHLSQDVLLDWRSWLIALLSALTVFIFKKISPVYIIIGSAAAGFLLHQFF